MATKTQTNGDEALPLAARCALLMLEHEHRGSLNNARCFDFRATLPGADVQECATVADWFRADARKWAEKIADVRAGRA